MPRKLHLPPTEQKARDPIQSLKNDGLGDLADILQGANDPPPRGPTRAVRQDTADGLAALPQLLGALPPKAPAAFTGLTAAQTRDDDSPIVRAPDAMEGVTTRLGARYWVTNKRFPWAKDALGKSMTFTRWYFRERVLVDVFPSATPSARREVERRLKTLSAHSEKIGYLPIVRGASVPEDVFARLLQGEHFPLFERQRQGVLA